MPRRRQIRPAPSPSNSFDMDLDDSDPSTPRQPQRNAANARERARMRVLSRAFCRLKTTLPWVPADTKLSKLDTLRLATSYIAHLRAVLTDQPADADVGAKHPITLTWPFSFQHSSTTTISSNCNSGGCWTNSRDSEEEEYQNIPHHQQNHTERSNQHIIIEYNPCYQQYDYNESVMHIG